MASRVPPYPLPEGYHWDAPYLGPDQYCLRLVADLRRDVSLATIRPMVKDDRKRYLAMLNYRLYPEHGLKAFNEEVAAASWVVHPVPRQGRKETSNQKKAPPSENREADPVGASVSMNGLYSGVVSRVEARHSSATVSASGRRRCGCGRF
jgi:hypothetical protein